MYRLPNIWYFQTRRMHDRWFLVLSSYWCVVWYIGWCVPPSFECFNFSMILFVLYVLYIYFIGICFLSSIRRISWRLKNSRLWLHRPRVRITCRSSKRTFPGATNTTTEIPGKSLVMSTATATKHCQCKWNAGRPAATIASHIANVHYVYLVHFFQHVDEQKWTHPRLAQ
jgi:hypothetical protein